MKLSILAVVALALSQVACGANSATDTKNLTSLIKTLQDDKACDRVRDIDIGAGAGQLGGEGHTSFKEHSECGSGHGIKAAPATGPTPSIPPAPAPPTP